MEFFQKIENLDKFPSKQEILRSNGRTGDNLSKRESPVQNKRVGTYAELHKWSENMVNIENCQFLKVNCRFLLVIWVKQKQSVCSITFLYSSNFYSLFLPFFVLEIFKFKFDTFFVRNSGAISKFDSFEQPWYTGKSWKIVRSCSTWQYVLLLLQEESTIINPSLVDCKLATF